MNRTTTTLLAALEAVIVVAVGIGIALVPLTIIWAVQYDLGVDWIVFWHAAADIWLAGNGVDLDVNLTQLTATTLGLPGADAPFTISVAILGFAMLTVLLGVRTGIRAAETRYRLLGIMIAIVVYGVLAVLITLSAASGVVKPSLWQGFLVPVIVYAVSVLTGAAIGRARSRAESADAVVTVTGTGTGTGSVSVIGTRLAAIPAAIPAAVRSGAAAALRAGTAASAAVFAVSGVLVAVLLVADYGRVIGLYEGLQGGALGGLWLTIAQLVFLPNLVAWAASWLVGPGFAIGTGSSVSALGSQLGPIPPVPLFGILPQASLAFGFIGIAVPVLAGFFAAVLIRSRISRVEQGMDADGSFAFIAGGQGAARLAAIGAGIGLVAGIELGLVAWWSSGALGPGRLHDVGPNPWMVGAIAAAEVGIAAVIGIFAAGYREHSRVR